MNHYEIKAYAKINLGLDVTGKRSDGYHLVKMVMQAIDLWDLVTLEKTQEGLTLTCSSGEVPPGEDNLAFRAARLMLEKFSISSGVHIHLQKNIPVAAGLGGGSADAAAVMRGISRLFALEIPLPRLMELGLGLGADIPFCLMGGTALAEGIGEKLTPLPPLPHCHILAAKPQAGISTGYVYEHLDAQGVKTHPDLDGMRLALDRGSLRGVLERLGNVLETVTIPALPVIDTLKARMLSLGAAGSLMSGSGPTVFGIFPDGQEDRARAALEQLSREGQARQVFLTRPAGPF